MFALSIYNKMKTGLLEITPPKNIKKKRCPTQPRYAVTPLRRYAVTVMIGVSGWLRKSNHEPLLDYAKRKLEM
jgi:hypothetical protein